MIKSHFNRLSFGNKKERMVEDLLPFEISTRGAERFLLIPLTSTSEFFLFWP